MPPSPNFCALVTIRQSVITLRCHKRPVTIGQIFTVFVLLGEKGAVYIYYGGSTFPHGNATRNCGVLSIEPCPQAKVS